MTTCKNCEYQFDNKFCPNCGLPAELERIDGSYFSRQIQSLFNFEKGIFYTIKELLLRPGATVRTFLFKDRRKHIKPLVYLIFSSIIFTFVAYLLGIHYTYFKVDNILGIKDYVDTGVLGDWLNNNIGYTNLVLGSFVAMWLKIFFKKFDYTFYEIFVMLCFVLGQFTLFLSLGLVIGEVTESGIVAAVIFLLSLLYVVWAIGQFFDKNKLGSYFKALLTLVLGNLSYVFVLMLIGFVYKLMKG